MENILYLFGGGLVGVIIGVALRGQGAGKIHFKLDRILRAVKADTAAEEALAAQNEDLRKQLQDILSGANLPPEVQKKIDAIFAASEANKSQLEKGISDNT